MSAPIRVQLKRTAGWQDSILMCASVDSDNARLIRMLQDQHIDGEDWKRSED